jgi:UTP:GlnB (protein PII) uridylyltransferase
MLFCAAAHDPPSLFSTTNLRTQQIKGAMFQMKIRAITHQKMLDIFIVLSPKNGT